MPKSFSNQENFYKRLRELSDVDARSKSTSLDQQSLVEYVRAKDGQALGIIKEDSSFYIKSSNTKGDIDVADFTYIGGLENKLRYKYDSLAEAKKNIGFFVGALNESMERKFNVALLKEEKDILDATNADKGGIATAQDKADSNSKGETLKTTAQEKQIADPLSKEGIANAQAEGDKKKADDASQKLKQGHEPSATSSGAARGDIAKAQTNADATTKGSIPTTAPEKEIAVPAAKTGGAQKAQSVADTNKSVNDGGAKLKTTEPKEVDPASDAKKEKAIVIENLGPEDGWNTNNGSIDSSMINPKSIALEIYDDLPANFTDQDIENIVRTVYIPNAGLSKERILKATNDPQWWDGIKLAVNNFKSKGAVAETGLPTDEPGIDASASAAGAEMGVPTPGGDETADLDAAASALDALDIKADADATSPVDAAGAGAPPADALGAPSAEVPSGDSPTAGLEGGGAGDGVDDNGIASTTGDVAGGDEAALKDVEKLVGKTAQKVRATELTDEMVGGFLKSIIAGFDGKLENLDSDLRRELANKILKAGEEGEQSNGSDADAASPSVPATTPDAENSSSAEPGAEKLPTGGAGEEGDEDGDGIPDDKEIEEAINAHLDAMGKGEEGGSNDEHPNSFQKYAGERGYDLAENISIMEMASLVTGYANECDGDTTNADMKGLAEWMSEEVKKEVTECGFGQFAEGVKVFNIKPKAYKSHEPVVEVHEKFEEDTIDETKVEFAPDAQSLNKADKEKKEDDKKEEVSESTKSKLSVIIQNKIKEQLGLKKSSVNESAKSTFSKKLDAMIAEQLKKEATAAKKASK